MATCYILAWVTPELSFEEVRPHSEGPDTITVTRADTRTPVLLLQADGRDYEEARRNALNDLANRAEYERGIWPAVKDAVDAAVERERRLKER